MTPEIKRFGKELREFINTNDVISMLEDGDWGAGGCWVLAKALVKYLGPPAELWAVSTSRFPAEHVVVKHDDVFFDYNGAGTAQELLTSFWMDYPDTDPASLALIPFTKSMERDARAGGMRCPPGYVPRLVAKLQARFGPHEYH